MSEEQRSTSGEEPGEEAADHTGGVTGSAGTGGGVVVGGSMTGGAVATGNDSRAKDSSRTVGPSPLDSLGPPSLVAPPSSVQPGGLFVGGHLTGGAAATAPGSEAEFSAVRIDSRHADLLASIDALISQLPSPADSPEGDALAGALDEVRQDITATGRATRGRLERLRDQLTTSNAALTALTSAVAVADSVRGLLS
ncbi:hypothetical protein AB0M29_19095 [Streptomyces sp. NPDC051976]|uniref:hypothetical protein n=1 Tax=Streptomyces sp. NPDC051976 TaxID=3154947 RepID=UPI0034467BB6